MARYEYTLSDEPEEFVIRPRIDGRRLDHYLTSRYPDYSRSVLQRIIEAGAVMVNGQTAKASQKVREGDVIRIFLPDLGDGLPTPENIPLRIVHEDEFLVVVDKAPGMVTHPARGNWSGTLVNALQYHFENLSSVGGSFRPGIVHRLDRDTTGLLIVAKEDQAHRGLALQFETRVVDKHYLALVAGNPERDADFIHRLIGHHPTHREKMAVRSAEDGGKTATTFYEVVERFEGFALIRCKLLTGRTHQIRVHLTSIGLPILADKLYSGRDQITLGDLAGPTHPESARVLINRQALHAHTLSFQHPVSGETIALEAALPADMAQTLEALRLFRPGSSKGSGRATLREPRRGG